MGEMTKQVYQYHNHKDKLLQNLRRIEGQV
jgi:DNA-binding FrmR family transcriptional regulator